MPRRANSAVALANILVGLACVGLSTMALFGLAWRGFELTGGTLAKVQIVLPIFFFPAFLATLLQRRWSTIPMWTLVALICVVAAANGDVMSRGDLRGVALL